MVGLVVEVEEVAEMPGEEEVGIDIVDEDISYDGVAYIAEWK